MGIFDWKHWIVILVVVVLVFGTKKLKTLGTDVGESIKGFRKAMSDEEKTGGQPPVQPLYQPQTLDATAPRFEEPIRKELVVTHVWYQFL